MDKPQFRVENRASERIPVNWRARLLLPQGQVIDTRAFDISDTGVGLLSDNPLVLKAVLQVALQVPTPNEPAKLEVVTGPAMVVFQILRNREYRVGMQWLVLPPETLKALSAWTGSRKPPPFKPLPGVIDL